MGDTTRLFATERIDMERTKSNFMYMREACGITQSQAAEALGVSNDTLRKWEKPSGNEPPEDAWEYIESAYETHLWAVDSAVEAFLDANDEYGTERASFTYYRNQTQYDRMGRDIGYFTRANANARAAAERILAMGFEVEFRYPENAIRTPGSRY